MRCTYQGSGAVRSLGPGAHFTLTEHADFVADYDYLVQSLALNQDRRQNANDQPPGTFKAQLGGQDNAPGEGSGGVPVGGIPKVGILISRSGR